MVRRLEGKIALVTGASRGIGRAIALRLGREGALVVVHYGRQREDAENVVNALQKEGGSAFALRAELGSAESVRGLYSALDAALLERTGNTQIDILVNNAGITSPRPFADIDEALFDNIASVNMKAPFFMVQQALTRLRDGGRIINLSSGASQMAMPEVMVYGMTKAAIDNFTRALALHLAPRRITVNAVGPGIIDTDMNAELLGNDMARQWAASLAALRRIGNTDDIAGVAAFLASEDARFVTGTYVDATGGMLLGRSA